MAARFGGTARGRARARGARRVAALARVAIAAHCERPRPPYAGVPRERRGARRVARHGAEAHRWRNALGSPPAGKSARRVRRYARRRQRAPRAILAALTGTLARRPALLPTFLQPTFARLLQQRSRASPKIARPRRVPEHRPRAPSPR